MMRAVHSLALCGVSARQDASAADHYRWRSTAAAGTRRSSALFVRRRLLEIIRDSTESCAIEAARKELGVLCPRRHNERCSPPRRVKSAGALRDAANWQEQDTSTETRVDETGSVEHTVAEYATLEAAHRYARSAAYVTSGRQVVCSTKMRAIDGIEEDSLVVALGFLSERAYRTTGFQLSVPLQKRGQKAPCSSGGMNGHHHCRFSANQTE
jgi:hypothetical protein